MTSVKDRWMWRLRTYLYPRLGRYRPDLKLNTVSFLGFRSAEVQKVADKVCRTRFSGNFRDVQGWLTGKERQLLYAFGRWHPGPFLEIGSWVGLSTCHLAAGIRDSRQSKRFITCDLNPTTANFRPTAKGVGFFYPAESSEDMGSCSWREYREEIEPIITSPDGVVGTLRRNLQKHELSEFVNIHVGPYASLPDRGLGFIFIDAMHSPAEIGRNAKQLEPFLTTGTLLICHDLNCHPDNERTLRDCFSYGHVVAVDQMLIGEIV